MFRGCDRIENVSSGGWLVRRGIEEMHVISGCSPVMGGISACLVKVVLCFESWIGGWTR